MRDCRASRRSARLAVCPVLGPHMREPRNSHHSRVFSLSLSITPSAWPAPCRCHDSSLRLCVPCRAMYPYGWLNGLCCGVVLGRWPSVWAVEIVPFASASCGVARVLPRRRTKRAHLASPAQIPHARRCAARLPPQPSPPPPPHTPTRRARPPLRRLSAARRPALAPASTLTHFTPVVFRQEPLPAARARSARQRKNACACPGPSTSCHVMSLTVSAQPSRPRPLAPHRRREDCSWWMPP
jgi:hypothetical protein